ncbi:DUF448 domain-containing protein [Alkalibaculum sp. M08DMB]|uniref:DUF448 domain-containing protein n=1 Tax=Alkalibaculum sporogenes TaxID=2655001 RepID=A0A6A7K901_9FIRM|nr:YlxR family protein [Alkalibaculum sporogenes]MPW25835.1 DUF448 domain-containing protein [Alkalibaculum sporogenes]
MKKIPQRTCVVCGNKIDKNKLIRIVKNNEDQIFYDKTGKANGRGAYICSNETCIESLEKSNVLNRTFKMEVNKEIKQKIKEDVVNGKR